MTIVAVGGAADVVAACGVACARAKDVPLTFDDVSAVVVDVEALPRTCDAPLVVLVHGRWAVEHPALFDRGMRHIVARHNAHDLAQVLRAIGARSAPAPETWLATLRAEQHVPVNGSAAKGAAIEATRAFATRLDIAERMVANACHVVEELVTNAVFNAPVDDGTGEHLFTRRKRSEAVVLPAGKAVQLSLRSDGVRLAITVVDPWGTLPPGGVHAYLAKGFRRGPDQVDKKEGGAGLGLYQVFDASSHLVVVLEPRKRTELTALIDAGGTYREFASESKSLNVFFS